MAHGRWCYWAGLPLTLPAVASVSGPQTPWVYGWPRRVKGLGRIDGWSVCHLPARLCRCVEGGWQGRPCTARRGALSHPGTCQGVTNGGRALAHWGRPPKGRHLLSMVCSELKFIFVSRPTPNYYIPVALESSLSLSHGCYTRTELNAVQESVPSPSAKQLVLVEDSLLVTSDVFSFETKTT